MMVRLRGCFTQVLHSRLPPTLARLSEREWRCAVIAVWWFAVAGLWWAVGASWAVVLEKLRLERTELARIKSREVEIEREYGRALQRDITEVSEEPNLPARVPMRAEGSQVMGAIYSSAAEVGLTLEGFVQDERCVLIDRTVSVGYQVRARGAYKTFQTFSALLLAQPVPIVMTTAHFAHSGADAEAPSLEAELCLAFVSKL